MKISKIHREIVQRKRMNSYDISKLYTVNTEHAETTSISKSTMLQTIPTDMELTESILKIFSPLNMIIALGHFLPIII